MENKITTYYLDRLVLSKNGNLYDAVCEYLGDRDGYWKDAIAERLEFHSHYKTGGYTYLYHSPEDKKFHRLSFSDMFIVDEQTGTPEFDFEWIDIVSRYLNSCVLNKDVCKSYVKEARSTYTNIREEERKDLIGKFDYYTECTKERFNTLESDLNVDEDASENA